MAILRSLVPLRWGESAQGHVRPGIVVIGIFGGLELGRLIAVKVLPGLSFDRIKTPVIQHVLAEREMLTL